MMPLAHHLMHQYGTSVITLAVALECAGLLIPGETVFFGAAIYASTTHHIGIVSVIAAASLGAILGNLLGYAIGRQVGAPMLARHGWRLGLTARRLALGRYLFRVHGGKVVFFCRFLSVLRSFNAPLAGASQMPFPQFLSWTVVGGIAWPCVHGLFAYALGGAARRLSGPSQVGLAVLTIGVVLGVLRFVKRNECRLEEMAMRSEQYEHHA